MYEIRLEKPVERFLRKLDQETQKRIITKIRLLERNPRLGKPLTGNLSGIWSLRFGKFRALYKMMQSELLILVLDVGHRKNIYEN